MSQIRLTYTFPLAPRPVSQQQAALNAALALPQSGAVPDELTFLGLVEASRSVTADVAGGTIALAITYTQGADFVARFPTDAEKIAATANLFTARLSLLFATPCAASAPVVIP